MSASDAESADLRTIEKRKGTGWDMFGRQRVIVVREPGHLPSLRVMGPLGALAAGLMAVVLIVAAIAVFIVLALVALATAGLGAAAIAGLAYWKRDQWTLPAYHWARDKTGQWRVTPWSGGSDESPPDKTPVAAE